MASQENNLIKANYYSMEIEEFQNILRQSPDLTVVDEHNRTPLHIAIQKAAKLDIINALLEAGADPNAKDYNGATPLFLVLYYGCNSDFVASIMSDAASSRCRNSRQETLAHVVRCFSLSKDLSKLSVDLSDDPNSPTESVHSLNGRELELVTKWNLEDVIAKDKSVIAALISAKADIFCRNRDYNTLLHVVRRSQFAKDLIPLGLDVNAKNTLGQTPLHCLFDQQMRYHTDLELVNVFIQNGANVNAKDNDGVTPLFMALKKGLSCDVVSALLSAGADFRCHDLDGDTLLHVVRSTSMVRRLVTLGLDINVRNTYGQTPLHSLMNNCYVKRDILSMVLEMIQNKADVNAKDNDGVTPLFMSVNQGKPFDVVKTMMSASADINCRDSLGNTLLHVVRRPDTVKGLILQGLDVNIPNTHGQTPLHSLMETFYVDHRDISHLVKEIIRNDVQLNSKDNNGVTALFMAVDYGTSFEIVDSLITAGADVKCRDSSGNSLLHVVKNSYVAKHLISLGLEVNVTNSHDWTPLHSALCSSDTDCNKLELIQELIENNADVNVKNRNGVTPLFLAVREGTSHDIVSTLISAGADINCRNSDGETLLHVVRTSNIAKELISHGLEINATSSQGWTPLHTVSCFSDTCDSQLLKELIENNADINAKNQEMSPLFVAIREDKNSDIVNALIFAGADIKCRDSLGNTLLHVVRNYVIANNLISLGLKVNSRNCQGQTPLHSLMESFFSDHLDIQKLVYEMIQNKGDINGKDDNGTTPLFLAVDYGTSFDIVNELVTAGADVRCQDLSGNSLLHVVKRCDVANYLIMHGIEVNSTNCSGETPLHKLVKRENLNRGDLELVWVLIENKADINARDKEGMTPLHIIKELHNQQKLEHLHAELFRILMTNGGDMNLSVCNLYGPAARLQNNKDWSFAKIMTRIDVLINYEDRQYLERDDFLTDNHFQYFEKCVYEVKKMREHSIGQGLSMYDFLKGYRRPIAINAKYIYTRAFSQYPKYFKLLIKDKIIECYR